MVDQKILEKCRDAIRRNLGPLDDIPPELANTVANVYYTFYARATAPNTPESTKDLRSFIDDTATVLSNHKYVKQHVDGLRRIDKRAKPMLYDYTVTFILDVLKYRIDRAHDKTGLRRMIERQFLRYKVNEIPNLYDLLKI